MANTYVKISELPAIQTVAGTDLLPIVDTSETETKKITKQQLLTDIPASELAVSSLTEATEINDADYLIINQSGTNKKISKANARFASGDEVYVGDTEPTGDDADSVKLWLSSDDALVGEGSYISNTYGTSQTIGYSQEYTNDYAVGKVLYSNNYGALTDITLNDNIVYYPKIEIWFGKSTDVSKIEVLWSCKPYTSKTLYVCTNIGTTGNVLQEYYKNIYFSSNTSITSSYGICKTTNIDSSISISSENDMKIYKVVGYK